jgi:16S rRNA (cytidine1402-2'-O)-methyltransferase
MYEAPHRIVQTLADIGSELGERTVAIGRELTKRHEFLAVRPISTWVSDPPLAQGEFVLLVYPRERRDTASRHEPDASEIAGYFGLLAENDALSRREALRQTARHFGISTRAVFDAVEHHRESGG